MKIKDLIEALDKDLESIINCIGSGSTLCELACERVQKARARIAAFRVSQKKDDLLTKDPVHWLSIKEAQKLRVCRVCRKPANPIQRESGTMNTFYLGHGHEFAHEDCLTPDAKKRMYINIVKTGPHRMD